MREASTGIFPSDIELPNLAEKIRSIRNRVKDARDGTESGRQSTAYAAWSGELAAARRQYTYLYHTRAGVGRMPPNPGTLRARISAQLIQLLRRTLFWYTPTIIDFNSGVVSALDHLCSLHERQLRTAESTAKEIEALREEIDRLRSGRSQHLETPKEFAAADTHQAPAVSDPAMQEFYFALQDRFRGVESEVSQKLAGYLRMIERRMPNLPPGPWVDLGCGRGEWLAMISAAGRESVGVDTSPAALHHCRTLGLNVVRQDALEYLSMARECSLSIISAFHFFEHCSFEVLFRIVKEAARTLKPGGLLVVEVPNPANVLMGSCHIWNDPTHHRPLPPQLLDFLLEYHGLRVAQRVPQNPAPENEHLPFGELEFVNQLNNLLYGPRDYGVIAWR